MARLSRDAMVLVRSDRQEWNSVIFMSTDVVSILPKGEEKRRHELYGTEQQKRVGRR